jgi:hypothetical protein
MMEPHRCPKCNALVVDRRSPLCTTCHQALPEEWVMSAEQIAKVTELDAHARAEYATAMNDLETSSPKPEGSLA